MYATRLYSTTGAGGGGDEVKPGRRAGLAALDAPPAHLPHHPHPVPPPPPSYQLYQGRLDPHRGTHFHHYHPSPHYLAPPPFPPHFHSPIYTYGGGGAPVSSCGVKKKTWNFIHEKMSYDTFFTMKRLIERSRRPDEVLRWITQNPTKISHNHYPVALQKIGQLLQATPLRSARGAAEGSASVGDRRQILEHPDFQTLCSAIINGCTKFDNFSVVNCLYAVAALGEFARRSQSPSQALALLSAL